MILNISSIYANMDEQMMYEHTAKEIVGVYGKSRGVCVEIGTGPGYLGLQLARYSDMAVYLVDVESSALEKAMKNAELFGVKDRINFFQGDAAALPFDDNFADLVVSRGSMWFWRDRLNSFKEIYRVLKPSGVAFIGGGFGSWFLPGDVWERIKTSKERQFRELKETRGIDIPALIPSRGKLVGLLKEAGIPNYRIVNDPPGIWVEIKKP